MHPNSHGALGSHHSKLIIVILTVIVVVILKSLRIPKDWGFLSAREAVVVRLLPPVPALVRLLSTAEAPKPKCTTANIGALIIRIGFLLTGSISVTIRATIRV